MTILLFLLSCVIVFFLICWLIGKVNVFASEWILENSLKRKKSEIRKFKKRELEAQKRGEAAMAAFSQKARLLQPKFENSEFCDLIAKFVFENYFLSTCNSKDESIKVDGITLEKDHIYIRAGAWLKFASIKYQNLNDDIELMAFAYALQSKLEQYWGNDTTVELQYIMGGYGEASRVRIVGFKIEEMKKVY